MGVNTKTVDISIDKPHTDHYIPPVLDLFTAKGPDDATRAFFLVPLHGCDDCRELKLPAVEMREP